MLAEVGIPTKSISDSEVKPINDSGAKPIMIGAKRRWRDDSGRSDRHPSTEIRNVERVRRRSRWECGNRASDFQGACGKRGKPGCWLSTLSTAPAFPRLCFLVTA